MTACLLAARKLACRRGERVLFDALELELHAGQIVWLRGSNGRGKTSLLRLLAGLSRPEAGTVQLTARGADAVAPVPTRALTYIAHANALKDDLTVTESLAFLARLHGHEAAAQSLHQALKTLGMHSRRDAAVRTLSQGQRRRVALARLLLPPAKPVWLLDEPYDALDSDACALLDGVLQQHAARGGAVLLTSHLPLAIRQPQPLEFFIPAPAAGAAT